jgi:hypothetical protein
VTHFAELRPLLNVSEIGNWVLACSFIFHRRVSSGQLTMFIKLSHFFVFALKDKLSLKFYLKTNFAIFGKLMGFFSKIFFKEFLRLSTRLFYQPTKIVNGQ